MNNDIKLEEKKAARQKYETTVILIEPSEKEIIRHNGVWMPSFCVKVYLHSDWAEGVFDFSDLVLIFFTNEAFSVPLYDLTKEKLKSLKWKEVACQHQI